MKEKKAASTVMCSGDQDSQHPQIFLHFDKKGVVYCPYCNKKFIISTHLV